MHYNFDEIIDRLGTASVKWDLADEYFKTPGLLPMWVADMDFKTPDFVVDAVKSRANHEIYGYTIRPDSYYKAAMQWIDELHGWKTKKTGSSFRRVSCLPLILPCWLLHSPATGLLFSPLCISRFLRPLPIMTENYSATLCY